METLPMESYEELIELEEMLEQPFFFRSTKKHLRGYLKFTVRKSVKSVLLQIATADVWATFKYHKYCRSGLHTFVELVYINRLLKCLFVSLHHDSPINIDKELKQSVMVFLKENKRSNANH